MWLVSSVLPLLPVRCLVSCPNTALDKSGCPDKISMLLDNKLIESPFYL
jgi:hypothetical protein